MQLSHDDLPEWNEKIDENMGDKDYKREDGYKKVLNEGDILNNDEQMIEFIDVKDSRDPAYHNKEEIESRRKAIITVYDDSGDGPEVRPPVHGSTQPTHFPLDRPLKLRLLATLK